MWVSRYEDPGVGIQVQGSRHVGSRYVDLGVWDPDVGSRCAIADVKVQLWGSRCEYPGIGIQVFISRCVESRCWVAGVKVSYGGPGVGSSYVLLRFTFQVHLLLSPGGWDPCVASKGAKP